MQDASSNGSMAEGAVLFWVDEPIYGCKQPVRVGDLMRVRELGFGWKEEGKVVMIIGVIDIAYTLFVPEQPDDLFPSDEPEECLVIVDGRRDTMRIEYLELLTD